MSRYGKEEGSLTLETALVLPLFLFLVLFLYSLFGIFSAQNQISHALFQASKSLSMDPYIHGKVDISDANNWFRTWGSTSDVFVDIHRNDDDPYFKAKSDWTEHGQEAISKVAKDRFIGYFAGGDEKAAREKLEGLGIVNGLDGIQMEAKVDSAQLTITVRYSIEYVFDFWDQDGIPMEQKVLVHLWKAKEH